MRGFLLGALVLVGLEVVLKAPSSRVAQVLATPAGWLAAWCDPNTPLISGSASSSSSTSTSSAATAVSAANQGVSKGPLGINLPVNLFGPIPKF